MVYNSCCVVCEREREGGRERERLYMCMHVCMRLCVYACACACTCACARTHVRACMCVYGGGGAWIGNGIYWILLPKTRDHTFCTTITHTLLSRVMSLLLLLHGHFQTSNGTFCWVPELSPCHSYSNSDILTVLL
jgi:hypothetical protein